MSVRDGADDLAATIDSVLAQEGVSFEFIVVNDGSRDDTASILDDYVARDKRIHALHCEPRGLTRALMSGCGVAKGEYIARQDCGDRSLPSRFLRQAEALDKNPGAVLAAVGTQFLGPCNEPLYEIVQDSEELRRGLACGDLRTIRGPSHHGATMFRRSAYETVGGYRVTFRVAQDLDLWLRLMEIGDCVALPAILYDARLAAGSISHLRRSEQLETTQAILDCALLRRGGESDADRLAEWLISQQVREARRRDNDRGHEARFNYFLANMLRTREPRQAREYYLRSLRALFWQPKVWFRLMTLGLR